MMNPSLYGRRWVLGVTKSGELRIRDIKRGPQFPRDKDHALPVYTVDTKAQAESLQIRCCVLSRVDNKTYFLNPEFRFGKTELDLDDLPKIGNMLQRVFLELAEKRRQRRERQETAVR